jgi:hypothetical protein
MAESHVMREAIMRGISYATVTVLICLMMGGCATYGALEEDYGNSYRAARNVQILDAAASKNLAPVEGLSGAAAEGALKKYTESFAPSDQTMQQSQMMQQPPLSAGTGMGQDAYGKK